ncbi:NUDIX domain-containing protein, partial [Mycobacterium tuberculosis]|nr:NUDIX domain-containing protein [Mycobacterium tuberculosis]
IDTVIVCGGVGIQRSVTREHVTWLQAQARQSRRLGAVCTGSWALACAGLLDADHPEDAIRREAEEETGYRVGPVEALWTAYQTPGAVTERLHYFVAPYDATMRLADGGGLEEEGEEIEVLELPLTEALTMIADGRIIDAKTIAL